MQEQTKRGPGRPRKAETKRRIDITLSDETIRYLDSQCPSRSEQIEQYIKEHRQRSEAAQQ